MPLKKHSPGCNCCPTEFGCDDFAACFGNRRTVEITFSGFSNGGFCEDCTALNRTYLFPNVIRPCDSEFDVAVLGICFLTISIRLHFILKRNQLGVFDLFIRYSGSPAAAGADYYHPNPFETTVLCDGGALTVPSITDPYTTPPGFQGCNYNGAPSLVRVL